MRTHHQIPLSCLYLAMLCPVDTAHKQGGGGGRRFTEAPSTSVKWILGTGLRYSYRGNMSRRGLRVGGNGGEGSSERGLVCDVTILHTFAAIPPSTFHIQSVLLPFSGISVKDLLQSNFLLEWCHHVRYVLYIPENAWWLSGVGTFSKFSSNAGLYGDEMKCKKTYPFLKVDIA